MTHIFEALRARYQGWQTRHFAMTAYGRRLKKYKDRHAGESCFFIGNGPSLRAEDLTRLREAGVPAFAFNRIYLIFGQTPWRPTYYISQDEKMLAGCLPEAARLPVRDKFIPVNLKWYHGVSVKNARYFLLKAGREEDLDFSDDFPSGACWASTVMYTAAQLAAYMGFQRIYLIGADHHFHISRDLEGNLVVDASAKDYFTEQYNADRESLHVPSPDNSTRTYIAMKKHCAERGIEVCNATRGGRLEVFPRVDFDELMSGDKL